MSIKGTGTSTLPKTDMVPSKRSFFITALDGSNSYRTVARHKRIKQMIILTSLGMRSYQSKKSFIQREFSSNYFLPAIFLKVSECDTRVATWNETVNTALYFIWCRTLMRHQSSTDNTCIVTFLDHGNSNWFKSQIDFAKMWTMSFRH